MTLRTLADVRELMRHLPEDRRSLSTWRQVAIDIEAPRPPTEAAFRVQVSACIMGTVGGGVDV
jgi:hypothetical protein